MKRKESSPNGDRNDRQIACECGGIDLLFFQKSPFKFSFPINLHGFSPTVFSVITRTRLLDAPATQMGSCSNEKCL